MSAEVTPEAALVELARREAATDFCSFMKATHRDYQASPFHRRLCALLDSVADGTCKRLAISCPPRSGKSLHCCVSLPAYILGRDPGAEVILTSYGEQLAAGFSRDCRRIMADPAYRSIFPTELDPSASAVNCWRTTAGGRLLASGAGGSLTGWGAQRGLIVVDDPISGAEQANSETQLEKIAEWFGSVVMTRATPDTAILVISTRWAVADLIGVIAASDTAEQWTFHNVPATTDGASYWPERFSADYLNDVRRAIGSRAYSALYEGAPVVRGGEYLRRDWFPIIDGPFEAPTRAQRFGADRFIGNRIRWTRAYDLATSAKKTADYTASVKVGQCDGKVYVADGINRRMLWPEAKARIIQTAAREPGVEIVIEGVGGHSIAVDEIRSALRGSRYVRRTVPHKDKLTRALPWIARAEAGDISLMRTGPNSDDWIDTFLRQCEAFPSPGAHDDMVDAMSMAFGEATKRRSGIAVPS